MLESPRPEIALRVAAVRALTPQVKSFELVAADGGELPAFSAGAHIDVRVAPDLVRSYSLIDRPGRRDRYRIAVLREPAGSGGSARMHDTVRAGDVLAASPPENRFEIDEGGDEHVLIAGGIGIAPLLAIGERLLELGADFRLHYCTRTRADAAFGELVEERFGERVRFHHTGGDPARRIDVVELLRVRPPGTHVYVCGPRPMIDAARKAAQHWPIGTVHFELFGTGSDPTGFGENRPFEIELARSGKTLIVPADRSILDVLAANGIRVKSVCKDGFCGTCTVRLVSGKVDHRDGVLDEEQRAVSLQVCVSRAQPGERLVLKL